MAKAVALSGPPFSKARSTKCWARLGGLAPMS